MYNTRLIKLEENPLPEIPSNEFITSKIQSEIEKEIQPLTQRVGTIENSFGVHTEKSNQRLHCLEEIIRTQNITLNNFMTAMTAPNTNHIPAINSNCRVVANTI